MGLYRQKTFEIIDFAIKKSLFDHPSLRSSPAVGEDFFYFIDDSIILETINILMEHYRQKTFEILDFAIKKSLFDHPS